MFFRHSAIFVVQMLLAGSVDAQSSASLQGYWLEPSGGIIQVAPCGDNLCATIVAFSHPDRSTTDINNPDANLRSRSLCGLQLGSGFTGKDAQHAQGGHIYDPKTGKTFSAAMASDGNTLRLRGYVGVKLFGKTEVWTPVKAPPNFCKST